MSTKTHYRKVFKSDHLGQADVEEFIEAKTSLIFTIAHVKQEIGVMVAGRKGNYNIAYFKEKIKPMVLNAGNSKIVRSFCGGSSFVEDWNNVLVQLYIDPTVKMKGEIVGGLKLNPKQPTLGKKAITPDTTKLWNNAKISYKEHGNLVKVLDRCDMAPEHQTMLMDECNQEAETIDQEQPTDA
jgi:hypothetical protein